MVKSRITVNLEATLLEFARNLSANNGFEKSYALEFLIRKGLVLLSLNIPDATYIPSERKKVIKCLTLNEDIYNKIKEISEKRKIFAEKYLHFRKKKEMLKKSKISYIVNELLYYGKLSVEYGL